MNQTASRESLEVRASEQILWQRRLGLGSTAIAFAAVIPILAAVVLAKPWLVGLAAVPLTTLVAELGANRPPRVQIRSSVGERRVAEADLITAVVEVTSSVTGVARLHIRGSGRLATDVGVRSVDLEAGVTIEVELTAIAERWGRAGFGVSEIEWRTPLGLLRWRATVDAVETVWVHPSNMYLKSSLGVSHTTQRSGPHRSRGRGAGVEFHSSRPFEHGDRWREVDHRVLARTGELWTRTRHADRSRDVVVIVDLVDEDADSDPGSGLADLSSRTADGMVKRHLQDRDRVGVLIMGAKSTFVAPRDGQRQAHLILDRLMSAVPRSPSLASSRGHDLGRRVSAGSTVVVISPLLDDWIIGQVHALRRAGRDVAVMSVGHDLVRRIRPDLDPDNRRAVDLHILKADAVRAKMVAAGIAVGTLGIESPPGIAVERLHSLHRSLAKRQR